MLWEDKDNLFFFESIKGGPSGSGPWPTCFITREASCRLHTSKLGGFGDTELDAPDLDVALFFVFCIKNSMTIAGETMGDQGTTWMRKAGNALTKSWAEACCW